MDIPLEVYKVLKSNSLLTCLYLPGIVYFLNYTGNLYSIGKQNTYMEIVLVLAEFWKYFRFCRAQKNVKRKFKPGSVFKSILALCFMIILFHVGAILFGAPFLTDQYETLFFAILMTVLTVLPICLYLEADYVYTLFTSLLNFEGNKLEQHLLLNIRFCIFGAWLGAIIIPLDWNRPYQEWPIPCCYGALEGCFLGNAYSYLHHAKYGYYDKRKEISTRPSTSQDTEDSKQLTTVIVFVISAILAIALLFVIAVFIDCRQEKLQKLNSKVKPKRKLKLKLPLPIVGRPIREDENSILDKMHVGECSGSLA